MELFNLIDLVRPGLLEDRMTFKEYTSKPIMLARAKDAKDDIKRIAKQREEELMRTISPAFVERKKEVVLKDSLTRKNEKVLTTFVLSRNVATSLILLFFTPGYILRALWTAKEIVPSFIVTTWLRNAPDGQCGRLVCIIVSTRPSTNSYRLFSPAELVM